MVLGNPIVLNLIPSGVNPIVYVNQYDQNYAVEFLLYNGSVPYNIPEGVSIEFGERKGDGYGYVVGVDSTAGSNKVTLTVTQQMTAVAGKNLCDLTIRDMSGFRVATVNFVMLVKKDPIAESVISESEIAYAEQVIEDLGSVAAYKAQLDENTENISAETTARINGDNAATEARSAIIANLAAEVTTRATETTSLQTQINQITSPTGDAPSAAEVENARIGADGTTYSTLGEAIRSNDLELGRAIGDGSSLNILYNKRVQSATVSGVTWTQNTDGSVTATGTASAAAAARTLAGNATTLPDGIIPGKTYYVKYSSTAVQLQVRYAVDGTFISSDSFLTDGVFTIPESTTGCSIRYIVSSGLTVNETVRAVVLNELTNAMLVDQAFMLSAPTKTIIRGEDLDTYLTDGQYRIPSAAVAQEVTNAPEAAPGQLVVFHPTYARDDTNVKIQLFMSTTRNIYMRVANTANEWTVWKQFADQVDVEDVMRLNATTSDGLSTGDDLNTYLTAGQWRVPTTAIGRSLKNRPRDFASTGLLSVMNTHNTNHVYQMLMTNGASNIWIRHIRIDIGTYDNWQSIVNGASGLYSWQGPGFLIHNPDEENADMIEVVSEMLGITISGTTDWIADDGSGNRTIPAAKIYELWDGLQQMYPQYIDAGESIGYSLDTAGGNYAAIKAYYIHPRKTYTNWSGNTVNIDYQSMPTIYLTAGTHGGESSPTWTLFEIFRRAFLTGTIYSAFLTGLQFRVVPVLDMWSYDHKKRYLAAAYNADGTQRVPDADLDLYDANRQCICSDMNNPSYSNLTLQSFAAEAAALTAYLNTHAFGSVEGDSYIDLHNCSYSLGYMTTDDTNLAHDFNVMVDALAKDWAANTTFANGDPVDYYASSTSDHTRQRGTILADPSVEKSYAWFFEKAYASYSSNILEVQQTDGSTGGKYAFAKAFDMTYRWIKTVTEKIKAL